MRLIAAMSADNDQKLESGHPPDLVAMIEALDRKIHDYLLHQHLSLWHPISTAPANQDVELIVPDGASSVVLPFPCRRANTGAWFNTDLRTIIHIQPTKWRPWQKTKTPKPEKGAGPTHTTRIEQRWSDT